MDRAFLPIFLLINLLTGVSLFAPVVGATEPTPLAVHDIHLHSMSVDQENYFKILYERDNAVFKFKTGIIYSGTYSEFKDPSRSEEANRELNKLLENQISPRRYIGLCGMRLTADDFDQRLESCLRYSSFVGLKLHLSGESAFLGSVECPSCDQPSKSNMATRLIEMVERLQKKRGGGIVVLHFNHFDFHDPNVALEPYGRQETSLFLEIVRRFPSVHFVMAHSGTGTAVTVENVAKLLNGAPVPTNLHFDTSAVLAHLHLFGCYEAEASNCKVSFFRAWKSDPGQRLLKAWRTPGFFKQIVFGSDYPYPVVQEAALLLTTDVLTAEERAEILENSRKLIGQFLKP